MDTAIEQSPKKMYVAYKISQNIACLEVQTQLVRLFLKLQPNDIENLPSIYRDVTNIGHYGTGEAEFTIKSEADLEIAKPFIELAYQKIGG